jgi:hypothetical protein
MNFRYAVNNRAFFILFFLLIMYMYFIVHSIKVLLKQKYVCTHSHFYFNGGRDVAFLLRPTVPTKVWMGAYTPTLSFLEVGSI